MEEASSWSDGEDFGESFSMEKIAEQNERMTFEMIEEAYAKLYGEMTNSALDASKDDSGAEICEVDGGYGGYGGYMPEPPPEPCHLEWALFINLRVRGYCVPQVPMKVSGTHGSKNASYVVSLDPESDEWKYILESDATSGVDEGPEETIFAADSRVNSGVDSSELRISPAVHS
jgi:hypothetical protein